MRYFTLPKQIAPWSLALSVAAASSLVAIAPQVVRSQIAAIDVSIARTAGETYQSLVRRSEEAVAAAVDRYFNSNRSANDVAVDVVAENNGTQVPILSLTVSRADWNSRPDPQAWATYLPQAERLLRIGEFAAPPPAPEPETAAPAAAPSQPTTAPTPEAAPSVPQTVPSAEQETPPSPQTGAPTPPATLDAEQEAEPEEDSSRGTVVCEGGECRVIED